MSTYASESWQAPRTQVVTALLYAEELDGVQHILVNGLVKGFQTGGKNSRADAGEVGLVSAAGDGEVVDEAGALDIEDSSRQPHGSNLKAPRVVCLSICLEVDKSKGALEEMRCLIPRSRGGGKGPGQRRG